MWLSSIFDYYENTQRKLLIFNILHVEMNQVWEHSSHIYIARFQITVLVRFSSVWFSLITVLLIVCPRSLLLCPFHKKLRNWWKKSFGFCQTDNPRSSFMMYCYSTDLNVYTWVEITYQNRQVFWIQFLTQPILSWQRQVTSQGGASKWNPYRKCYQPDWRYNMHRY